MKIKVYTTPTCPSCRNLKNFLHEQKIEFEEIDVSKDHKSAVQIVEKSGQMQVPILEFEDGEIILGFDKVKIINKLNIK
ncbi:MAG: glutaredoxin domain-containing protein [Patescibacteria group bacterium]|nr:glutaredoxin domain-containing protein [Patescibacteria group bacterium]